MPPFIIPTWPQYDDRRELKPPVEPEALTALCKSILDEHGTVVDRLHPDVRKLLAVGHNAGRKWACREVRQYLVTAGRDQLLENYFEKLEAARQAALSLPFAVYLAEAVQQALQIQVDPKMSHELRIQLRDALVLVQKWANDAEASDPAPSQRKPRANPRHHAARAARRHTAVTS